MREYQVRICERLGVKFPGPTRHVFAPLWKSRHGSITWVELLDVLLTARPGPVRTRRDQHLG